MESVENNNKIPLVSVVMITWNRKDLLRQVLGNLLRQTYRRYEVIIADNASTDGTARMIKEEFPQVVFVQLKENCGIKGYNIALEHAHGEYVMIMDDDSFFEDEGIEKAVKKFQQFFMLGALGCKVYNYYSKEVHYWHPTIREDDFSGQGFDSPLFNGCAAAARMSVLKEVGFYPEEFFLYENERDLCTRIINAGYEVKYFTDISVYHMVLPEQGINKRRVFYATRNLIWYFWKYLPLRTAFGRTAFVVALSVLSGIRKFALITYLKPVGAAFCGLPKILRIRAPIKKKYIKKVLY
ncbi:MAG: glycosyltransferase family 2 protein [Candidatus Omnitrophota bacterium]|jgi:hypothetical protein